MEKISRKEFLQRVQRRCPDLTIEEIGKAYDAMFEEISVILEQRERVCLSKFGSFHVVSHKGHPINFHGESKMMADYPVIRFLPSVSLNERVRKGS